MDCSRLISGFAGLCGRLNRAWGLAVVFLTVIGLAAMNPAPVAAQSVSLAPLSAENIVCGFHTVTATVSGVSGVCTGDGSTGCTTDGDCSGVGGTCSFAGYPVWFASIGFCAGGADNFNTCVDDTQCTGGDTCFGGPNLGDLNSGSPVTTDDSGKAVLGYFSNCDPGIDTIQACADEDYTESFEDPEPSFIACATDTGGSAPDQTSNTVTKNWIETFPAIVDLEPLSAVNPFGTTHTVTATITGYARCIGGTNDGTVCTSDAGCAGGGTCTDKSGLNVGFQILSGPNGPQDLGYFKTDANGVATAGPYTDTNGVGIDQIQACLDADSGSTPDENTPTTLECISDSGIEAGADFASNPVTKYWVPVVTLTNKDAITGLDISGPAYNPVGTSHTVHATVTGTARCTGGSNNGTICGKNADCTGGGTCTDKSGLTVGFLISSGPNAGDKGWTTTNSSGVATLTYPDTGGAGLDTIQSCLDRDASSPGVPDENKVCFGGTNDGTFCADDSACTGGGKCIQAVAECINDNEPVDDVASNTVLKYWLSSYVTGGGKFTKPDKSWDSFGGTVGQKPKSTDIVGEWDETAHASKGGNFSCHWNTFTSLAFSCTNGPCGTTPDTVQFKTGLGTCGAGSAVTVTIVDGRKKPDTISVKGATGAASALNVGTPTALGTGNFTLHP